MKQRFEYKTTHCYGVQGLPGYPEGWRDDPSKDGWRIIKIWRSRDSNDFIVVWERPFEEPSEGQK